MPEAVVSSAVAYLYSRFGKWRETALFADAART